jgi:uncharacterized protein
MSIRGRLSGVCAAILLGFGVTSSSIGETGAILDLATFTQSSVEVGSASRPQHFNVWIADTGARQTQGLMFVRDLPAGRGMLFVEAEARPIAFWMKNTYIELDMLFVGADHRIVKIAARAPPLSLATISSGAPVIAVLEIKGGEAARRGIRIGDPVSWPQA